MPVGIFVGLSTIDVVYRVDKFPAPDTKIAAQTQDVYVGGPATNAAVAFAHLGGSPTLATAVGRHAMADVIRKDLDSRSVRIVDLSPEFTEPPTVSSVSVDSAGRRNVISANAGRITVSPAEADAPLVQKASVMLVDGHFMQACRAWAAAAHGGGKPVVLDGGSW